MRDINLPQENLAVQWQYVKRNLKEMGVAGNFDDFERRAHRTVQNLMQSDIYEEFAEQIGAKRYEYAPLRIDNRKGEYQRHFTTTFGTSLVNIPVARDGTKIKYRLFDRYRRRRKKFDDTVVLSMILGLSTGLHRRRCKPRHSLKVIKES